MASEDHLKRARSSIVESSEKLKEFKKMWENYESIDTTLKDKAIRNTFGELIFQFEKLLVDMEVLYISEHFDSQRVNILQDFLYQSPHIKDNQDMKDKLDNELKNLKERYQRESDSFIKYFRR